MINYFTYDYAQPNSSEILYENFVSLAFCNDDFPNMDGSCAGKRYPEEPTSPRPIE
jgi:hypothetical protein